MNKKLVSLRDGLYLISTKGGKLYSSGLSENEYIYYDNEKRCICFEDECFIGHNWLHAYQRLCELNWVNKHEFYYVEDTPNYKLELIDKTIAELEEKLISLYKQKASLTGNDVALMQIRKDLLCSVIDQEELAVRANCSIKNILKLIYDEGKGIEDEVKERLIQAYKGMVSK